MKTFMENWAQQDKLAHESRRIVYERLELLGRQVERVATDVHNMQQDIAELKKEVDEDVTPVLESFKLSSARKLGAMSVWALVGGAILAVVSALAFVADKVASYIFHKP